MVGSPRNDANDGRRRESKQELQGRLQVHHNLDKKRIHEIQDGIERFWSRAPAEDTFERISEESRAPA
jgi:hypothetical protein